MRKNYLIERAEAHERISGALRRLLAQREEPRTPRQKANAEKLFAIALDSEDKAAKMRVVADILKSKTGDN